VSVNSNFLNILKNPFNVFSNATFFIFNISQFSNSGLGAKWSYFDQIWDGVDPYFFSTDSTLDFAGSNEHRMVTMVDPVTGHARIIFGDDGGVYTAVDDGTGHLMFGIGTAASPNYSRNGNLQIPQFFYGAAQPSNLAAQASQALFYGASRDSIGLP